MLPNAFLEWWFAPWTYAVGAAHEMPVATDQLGKRDGYRLWCRQARVSADLPTRFDTGWHVAMTPGRSVLITSARLFAGLLMARQQNHAALNALPFADRKWCASIAATQPLRARCQAIYAADDALEVQGLVELAYRIEQGFPGMWCRLRLMLPTALAGRVDELLSSVALDPEDADPSAVRAQRCWLLCQQRAASGATQSSSTPAAHTDNDADEDVQNLTTEMTI